MSEYATAVVRLRDGRLDPPGFLEVLARTQLWVPVAAQAPDGSGGMQLRVFEWQGRPHGAVFSSADRMAGFGNTQAHVVLTGQQLAATWPRDLAIAVDPGSPQGLVLPGEAMASVAAGGREAVEAGSPVAIGEPATPPPAHLRDALVAACVQTDVVRQAWLFQLHQERLGSRLVAGVQLAEGTEAAAVMPALAEAVAGALSPEEPLDLLVLSGAMLDDVAARIQPVLPPRQGPA
jgi:hypothetical protein